MLIISLHHRSNLESIELFFEFLNQLFRLWSGFSGHCFGTKLSAIPDFVIQFEFKALSTFDHINHPLQIVMLGKDHVPVINPTYSNLSCVRIVNCQLVWNDFITLERDQRFWIWTSLNHLKINWAKKRQTRDSMSFLHNKNSSSTNGVPPVWPMLLHVFELLKNYKYIWKCLSRNNSWTTLWYFNDQFL